MNHKLNYKYLASDITNFRTVGLISALAYPNKYSYMEQALQFDTVRVHYISALEDYNCG
jgi:hypothetical protein